MPDTQRPRPPFRSKPCRFYLAGRCPKGDACKFIHHEPRPVQSNVDAGDQPESSQPAQARVQAPDQTLPARSESSPSLASSSGGQARRGVNSRPKRGELPCYAWKAGSCPKGDKCWYSHDPEAQEVERRRREAIERRAAVAARKEQAKAQQLARERAEQAEREQREQRERIEREARERALQVARERAEREARERAEREAREAAEREARAVIERARREREAEERRIAEERLQEEEKARRAAQAVEDAEKIIQRAVFGSIVTFGAGLSISGLITGFECCSVRVRNLPADATDREICTLFTQQGIDSSRFLLASVKRLSNNIKEATVIMDAESGQALSVGLDELEFRDRHLAFEVGSFNTPGKMGQSTARDLDTLTISWRAPSVRYVATYESLDVAEARIRELNGTTRFGRRLKVEKNSAPPGRLMFIDANSVKISDLPPSVTDAEVSSIAHTTNVRRLASKHVVLDIPQALDYLRNIIETHMDATDSILSFNRAPEAGRNNNPSVTILARFSSWGAAKRVHDFLKDAALPHLWSHCWLKLPSPFLFNITIPNEQFEAQRPQWNDLTVSAKEKGDCNINVLADPGSPVRRIRLTGSDKAVVGAMRVRVENLAAGNRLEGWHPSLASKRNDFVRSLAEQTSAYVRADWRQRQIKAYGSPQAIELARVRITEELARLARIERTTVLSPNVIRFFAAHGVAELQDLLTESNVKFNAATRVLTVSGSDEAHHAVSRLIQQALHTRAILDEADGQQLCPICFDDVSVPVQLGCEHTYCASCLRGYLSSAIENDTFPVVCQGNEGGCNTPIPIPAFERFLTPPTFTRLIEVAFSDYITKRPQELRYCKTVDCTQIYRASSTPTALQCPSCLSSVCSSCHEGAHDDLSCANARMQRDPAEQDRALEQWLQEQGGNVKKCPQCNLLLEKTGGCNHISCRCGAHVCWRCLGVYPAGDIYRHMQAAHGGMFDEEMERARPAVIDGEAVDMRQQEQLYAQAQNALRLAEARRQRERDQLAEQRLRAERQRRQFDEDQITRRIEQARLDRVRYQEQQAQWQRQREADERRERENRSWCTIM